MSERTRRHHGQSMVEFALILPVLLLLVIGFLDLGRGVYTQAGIANAAREGARSAIIRTNDAAAIRTATKANAIGVELTDDDITITPAQRISGQPVTVHVTNRFYAITPFVTQIMNDGAGYLDLESTATMTVE